MSYWPFSHDSQAEQTQSNLREPSPHHNTRSSGQPLLPPLGRANGPRSPSALAAASPGHHQFFPPDLAVEPASPSNFEDASQPPGDEMAESEVDRLARVAEAAIQAATAAANALAAAQARVKKPELPPFDKKNVDIWIQRMEAAYTRAGVTTAKDKFAYLEPKFPVDFNVTINSFLFGEATDARWREFIAYLKEEFGKNKRQQTAILLSAHSRSGLRPTQFLINLKDKTKKVTMDHIYKEILFKSLPSDVQHSLVDKIDNWTADEAAEACDKYFDNEGRPLTSSSSTASVNAVDDHLQPEPYSSPFQDSTPEEDVNAVSFRRFSKDNKFGSGRQPNNSFKKPFPSNSSSSRPQAARQGNNPIRANGLCFIHDKHGDKANLCFPGCSRFSTHKGQKASQGNGSASRRT